MLQRILLFCWGTRDGRVTVVWWYRGTTTKGHTRCRLLWALLMRLRYGEWRRTAAPPSRFTRIHSRSRTSRSPSPPCQYCTAIYISSLYPHTTLSIGTNLVRSELKTLSPKTHLEYLQYFLIFTDFNTWQTWALQLCWCWRTAWFRPVLPFTSCRRGTRSRSDCSCSAE